MQGNLASVFPLFSQNVTSLLLGLSGLSFSLSRLFGRWIVLSQHNTY